MRIVVVPIIPKEVDETQSSDHMMSRLSFPFTYQSLKDTYFLPLLLIWPIASSLHFTYNLFTAHEPGPRRAQQGPSRKCRYRLDLDSSHVLNLPDGRKLGYAEYGCPTGKPIFTLHGFPGCRLEAAWLDDLAKKHDARIIAVDRPGIGWSSPQPGRKVVDHAKDVEALADHLELKGFHVMGTSGGGPYALACARTMPSDKLKGVAVVVGMGTPDMSNSGMYLFNRVGWSFVNRYLPSVVRLYWSRQLGNQLHLDEDYRYELMLEEISNAKMHPKEVEVWADIERREDIVRLCVRRHKQEYGQGLDSLVREVNTKVSDWGFRIEDIRQDLPIDLWYGKFDGLVPAIHGELLASRLGPKANLRILEETHMSLQLNYQEEILMRLLGSI